VLSGVKRNVFRRDAENGVTIAFDCDIDLDEALLDLFLESGRRRLFRHGTPGQACDDSAKDDRPN